MNEEKQTPSQSSGSTTDNSWQEVGRQFESLGESLAQAVRAAWEDQENQRRLQEMRKGLESMVQSVGQAIDDSANSPQGQRVRQEAGRAAESAKVAAEQTFQEVRPQLIDALQKLNTELQKLVDRIEQKRAPSAGGPPPEQGPGAGPAA